VQLAPELGEAHSALADVLAHGYFDFKGALAEHERAVTLSPNEPGVLLRTSWFLSDIGRGDEAAPMARRGVSLDQLNWRAYRYFAVVLDDAHRYPEAIEAADRGVGPQVLRYATAGLGGAHVSSHCLR
jgi:tetratricopeptide (TPR) repeat protein